MDIDANGGSIGDPTSDSLRLLKSDDNNLTQLHKDVLQLRDMLGEVMTRLDNYVNDIAAVGG